MADGLGYGKIKLVNQIIKTIFQEKYPQNKKFNYNEMLYVIQELFTEEGKAYADSQSINKGHAIFRFFVEHLLYRNIANYDSMVLLTSDKGCLTDDTLIEMPRDLKKYPRGIPMKDLIDKGPIYVYSFNKETKKIELKLSDGVQYAKTADVYELELKNGMKIKATEDHPFMLIDGTYKQLKDIIYKNGRGVPSRDWFKNGKRFLTDRLRIFCRPAIFNSNNMIKIDYNKIDRKNADTSYNHSMMEPRFIMEQLGYNIKNKVIHHIDHKHYNNNIENLELLDSQSEHYKEHNMSKYAFQKNNKFCYNTGYNTWTNKEKIKNGTQEFVKQCINKRTLYCKENGEKLSKIAIEREQNNLNSNHIKFGGAVISIKYLGKQKVYDVVNVRDNKNFIANGFVVSNTGKSSAAMMMARAWCKLIGIRFDPARHMAYNNSDVMYKIDNLNPFEPIVCVGQNTRIRIRENGKEKSVAIKKLVNKKDYEVLTYNIEKNIFEYQKPKKTVLTKYAKTYTLELENGLKLYATPEHLVYTKNRGYVQLQNLITDDDVLCYLNSSKVKSIKKGINVVPVYDIIGTPNHNFVGENMLLHNCDEAVRFASSADWAKKEHKALKKKLAEVRTKHLLFILCFPLKIQKVEKTYLESFTNYWIDLYDRGVGAIYVKDKNPSLDSWRIKDFKNVGSYTEFTSPAQIREKLKKHPNFWQIIKFPKPPEWLYSRYLKVREKNVYDEESVMSSISKEDINNALLILALRDIMLNDVNLTMNRIILHVKNEYDIPITKGMVEAAVKDAKQLVVKIREGIVNG